MTTSPAAAGTVTGDRERYDPARQREAIRRVYGGSRLGPLCRFSAHKDEFYRQAHGLPPGTPFSLEPSVAFRAGETTIWGGQNNVGKSMLLGQEIQQWALRGERTLLISIEMTPGQAAGRMFRQACRRPLAPDCLHLMDFWADWIGRYLIDCPPEAAPSPGSVLGTCCEACAAEPGIRHIVIDNLMTVVPGEDTINAQKDFITEAVRLAQAFGVHMHIVHHVRKPADADSRCGRYELRGSAAISDRVDTVLMLARNQAKEERMKAFRRSRPGSPYPAADYVSEPDLVLSVAKNRHGRFRGEIPLWFDSARTLTFTRGGTDEPPLLVPAGFWQQAEAKYADF